MSNAMAQRARMICEGELCAAQVLRERQPASRGLPPVRSLQPEWRMRRVPGMDGLDRAVLRAMARKRRRSLTRAARGVTMLGSPLALTALTAAAVVVLAARHRRTDALQLVIASAGAGILDQIVKHVVERQRPTVVPRLAKASGFSYPSGHAMASSAIYLTLSLVVSRQLPAARPLVHALGISLVVSIALSRLYLGVHYPSDVVGGVCLGVGWALLVNAVSVAIGDPFLLST